MNSTKCLTSSLCQLIFSLSTNIYAYRPATLQRLVTLTVSPLEQVEKLEQLRALQNGIAIQVLPTEFASVGVDTPEDLEKIRNWNFEN